MNVKEEFKDLFLAPNVQALDIKEADKRKIAIRHDVDYLLGKLSERYDGLYAFITTQTTEYHEHWKVDSVVSPNKRYEPKHKTWVIKFVRDPTTLAVEYSLEQWISILKPLAINMQEVVHVKVISIHPSLLGCNINANIFVLCSKLNRNMLNDDDDNYDVIFQSLMANKVMKIMDIKIHQYHNAFVSNLTHKIRTPLNGILYMGPLLSETQLTPTQQEYMNAVTKSSIALASVISDTVDISRLAFHQLALKKEVFSIQECVEESLQHISGDIISRKIQVNTIMDSSLPSYIYCDYKRLRQILIILLNNAVAFTNKVDGSGVITLRVSATIVSDGDINVGLSPIRSMSGNTVFDTESSQAVLYMPDKFIYYSVEFSVGDNGIGMTEEQKSTILDSFWLNIDNANITGSDQQIIYDTSGLGLAIAQKLSQLMGGDLWLSASELDKGSQFIFNVIAPEDVYPSYITHNSLKSIRGKNVLVVDSDSNLRIRFHNTVTKWGMNCISVSTQEEVIFIHLKSKTPIHIMFINEAMLMHSSSSTKSNIIKTIRQGKHTFPIIVIRLMGDGLNMLPKRTNMGGGSGNDSDSQPNAYLVSPIDDKELMSLTIDLIEKKKQAPTLLETKSPEVLIAEDDKVNQIVFENILPRLGYHKFTITSNGRDALKEIVNNPYKYGIILIDIRMPIMDGITLSECVWKLYNTTLNAPGSLPYMIGVSAQPLHESDPMGKLCAFVPKPIDIKQFEETLRRASA